MNFFLSYLNYSLKYKDFSRHNFVLLTRYEHESHLGDDGGLNFV